MSPTARSAGQPLHQFKAGLFKALGHPVRLRTLELLARREMSVRDLLRELEVEPSTASQQLGILRAQGVVDSRRADGTVYYRLKDRLVVELLDVGRRIFTRQVRDLQHLLDADTRASLRAPRRTAGRAPARPKAQKS